jgi:hypothetical protein
MGTDAPTKPEATKLMAKNFESLSLLHKYDRLTARSIHELHDFFNAPNMIRNASRHRWRDAQRLVDARCCLTPVSAFTGAMILLGYWWHP